MKNKKAKHFKSFKSTSDVAESTEGATISHSLHKPGLYCITNCA